MRTLLIICATEAEIAPLLQHLSLHYKTNGTAFEKNGKLVRICVTGVGMVNTAYEMGRLSSTPVDLALNVGVAGAFHTVSPGTVVAVSSDQFSELGAQDDTAFLPIDQLGFAQQEVAPLKRFELPKSLTVPLVKGITVNTVHGHEGSIVTVQSRTGAAIESMEGAAFYLGANKNNWTSLQIRAISNHVEKRDKSKWQMQEAVSTLNTYLINLLQTLDQ